MVVPKKRKAGIPCSKENLKRYSEAGFGNNYEDNDNNNGSKETRRGIRSSQV